MLTLRVRYKLPDADNSTRMDVPLVDRGGAFERATTDFRFAASVAEFGMILRNSPYKGTARMDSVLDIAEGAVGPDRNGYRKEFITLVQRARNLIRLRGFQPIVLGPIINCCPLIIDLGSILH
jgi:Ca-activated chloride channel family protein